MSKNKLLEPCNPCVSPGAPCEQCMFGYRSAEDNHKHMKELLEAVLNGEKPHGWKCATTYMAYHHDWKERIGYEGTGPKIEVVVGEPSESKPKYVETDEKVLTMSDLCEEVVKWRAILMAGGFNGLEANEIIQRILHLAFTSDVCVGDVLNALMVKEEQK